MSEIISVGASREAIAEARAAINEILKAPAEQETLRAALLTLSDLCAVKNVTISNNTFTQQFSRIATEEIETNE